MATPGLRSRTSMDLHCLWSISCLRDPQGQRESSENVINIMSKCAGSRNKTGTLSGPLLRLGPQMPQIPQGSCPHTLGVRSWQGYGRPPLPRHTPCPRSSPRSLASVPTLTLAPPLISSEGMGRGEPRPFACTCIAPCSAPHAPWE